MLIPKYAANVPPGDLVKIVCRGGCRGTRLAVLEPAEPHLRNMQTPEQKFYGFKASCLRCGYRATDNYNWYRP